MWTTDITGASGYSEWNSEDDWESEMLDYNAGGGTSCACPVAAGVAALILSVEPTLTNVEVRHFLERSAKDLGDPGWDEYYGWGRVDARAALDMALAKRADLNNDWVVDEEDESLLIQAIDANELSTDIAPAVERDGVVDANDLAFLTQYLGTEIPELGLIAHWKLDETEGMVVPDTAGRHHAATVMGVPLWQPEGGMIGGALQFNGMPNSVMAETVRDPSEGPFSVIAWVKGGGPNRVIVSQSSGADWLYLNLYGMLTTDVKADGRNGNTLTSDAHVLDDQWHRVVMTWDGTYRTLQMDGVEVARDTQPNLAASSGVLQMGAGKILGAGTFWPGLIDEVRVYNRAVRP